MKPPLGAIAIGEDGSRVTVFVSMRMVLGSSAFMDPSTQRRASYWPRPRKRSGTDTSRRGQSVIPPTHHAAPLRLAPFAPFSEAHGHCRPWRPLGHDVFPGSGRVVAANDPLPVSMEAAVQVIFDDAQPGGRLPMPIGTFYLIGNALQWNGRHWETDNGDVSGAGN